jgi:hypothetical protein
MQQPVNRNLTIAIILVTLVVVTLAAASWAVSGLNQPFNPMRPVQPLQPNPTDFELFYIGKAVVSSINITLLVFLVFLNIDIFRKTRSKFTFGLLIFSTAFLFKDLTSSPVVIGLFGYRLAGLGPFALLPDLFEFIVLSTLLYLSLE